MVEVRAFHGCLFRDLESGDAGLAAAPPYDVLDEQGRARFAARSASNVVHLTLPQAAPGDDVYLAAARLLAEMAADGRLVRDAAPAMYLQDVTFTAPGGRERTRRGLLAVVRLEPLGGSGSGVRGHEEVLPKPLEDRTRLLAATEANLEPIFLLYGDPAGDLDAALAADRARAPLSRAEFDGCSFHFRRASRAAAAAATAFLADRPLYVADGHHRYTVSQRYSAAHPEIAGARYRLALLVRAEDEGVVILPTHRFVAATDPALQGRIRARLAESFRTERVAPERLLAALAAEPRGSGAFGVWFRGEAAAEIARPSARAALALGDVAEPLRELDVVLIHRVLLDPAALGSPVHCSYVRGEDDPVGLFRAGQAGLGLFTKPPAVETVCRVSDRGLFMPPKSTYFYPKAASGQVLYRFLDGAAEGLA